MITSSALKERSATRHRRLNNSFADPLHCSDRNRKSWEKEGIVQSSAQVQNEKSLPFTLKKALTVQLSVPVSWQWIGPWLCVETATKIKFSFSHSRIKIQRFRSFSNIWFQLSPLHQGASLLCALSVASFYGETQHLPILIIGVIRRKDQYLG